MSASEPPIPEVAMQQLRSTIPTLTTFLHNFSSSTSKYQVLTTITRTTKFPSPLNTTLDSRLDTTNAQSISPDLRTKLPAPKQLYILDSSFNPPTLAHARIALSALQHDTFPTKENATPKRLILLLSTQNADKAPKPASFEQRIIMMQLFARDLLNMLSSPSTPCSTKQGSREVNQQKAEKDLQQPEEDEITIDIALTTLPYFHNKAAAISLSGYYPSSTSSSTPQTHLLGYDTLIRLLDTKYYPPTHTLVPIQPFLSSHRLRVSYRTGGDAKEKDEQDRYLKMVGDGKREEEGGLREWITENKIEMVDTRGEGEEVVSSTRVREVVKSGEEESLGKLVSEGVRQWILGEGLYAHE